jgi:hypothetical protein
MITVGSTWHTPVPDRQPSELRPGRAVRGCSRLARPTREAGAGDRLARPATAGRAPVLDLRSGPTTRLVAGSNHNGQADPHLCGSGGTSVEVASSARRLGAGGRSVSGGDEVIIALTDAGAGFTPAEASSTSFGLRRSIVGRMTAVGGSALIEAAVGGGTRLTLTWRPPADGPDLRPDQFRPLLADAYATGLARALAFVPLGWHLITLLPMLSYLDSYRSPAGEAAASQRSGGRRRRPVCARERHRAGQPVRGLGGPGRPVPLPGSRPRTVPARTRRR